MYVPLQALGSHNEEDTPSIAVHATASSCMCHEFSNMASRMNGNFLKVYNEHHIFIKMTWELGMAKRCVQTSDINSVLDPSYFFGGH